jgi:hypothetical protein
MRRAGALLPAVVVGLAGLCSALLLLGDTRQRTVLMASAAPDARQVAAGITREKRGAEGGRRRLARSMLASSGARSAWRKRASKSTLSWIPDFWTASTSETGLTPQATIRRMRTSPTTQHRWTPLHRPVRIARCALVHRLSRIAQNFRTNFL